jgi:hypothetical protein
VASCPRLTTCPLYPLFTLRATLAVWQTNYCSSNFAACARFRLAEAGAKVAPNLLPNGKTLQPLGTFGGE